MHNADAARKYRRTAREELKQQRDMNAAANLCSAADSPAAKGVAPALRAGLSPLHECANTP